MAKGAYIGINGAARQIKKIFVGVDTDVPIYSDETKTVEITATNITDYFEVTNGNYYFVGSGSIFTTNNAGVNSSTASTVLKAKQDISVLSFSYSYSSESSYDKFTLKVAGTTVEDAVSGATTQKTYSGSLAKNQTIEFTYAKDGSTHKNDDQCTFYAMSITGTLKTQTGTENRPVARSVKKAYVGIGGVARPFWGVSDLTYYGRITSLSSLRENMGSASVLKKYLLFAGGYDRNDRNKGSYTNVVEVYDEKLVKTAATGLYYATASVKGGSVGNYAVFDVVLSDEYFIEAYDVNLTKTTLLNKGSYGEKETANVGDYLLFARKDAYDSYAIDKNLVIRNDIDAPYKTEKGMGGASTKNHALFGGGEKSNGNTEVRVCAYDKNLVKSYAGDITEGKDDCVGASVGGSALFAGGRDDVVDAFDENLIKSTTSSLQYGRNMEVGISSENYALFCGGYIQTYLYPFVDGYDSKLVKVMASSDADFNRYHHAGGVVGNYAIIAGGLRSASLATDEIMYSDIAVAFVIN